MAGARVRLGTALGGRYRLDAVAGRGGVGVVHRATDLTTAAEVQVTVPYARVRDALDPAAVPLVRQRLADLDHPALAAPSDLAVLPVPFLVTRPVSGRSLGALLEDGPIDAARTAEIGAEVAGALAALHARDVVHGLVRPGAVALTEPSGAPVLLDAGVGALLRPQYWSAVERLLGVGARVGPEQVWNEPAGPASDVYALGLVLLECLLGTGAFSATEAADPVARTLAAPVIPDTAPAGLAALLGRMTAFRPEDRPAAAEVVAALRPAPRPLPVGRRRPEVEAALEPAPPAPSRPRRRGGLALAGLAVLVCALTAAGSASASTPRPAAVQAAPAASASAPVGADRGSPAPSPAPVSSPRPARRPAATSPAGEASATPSTSAPAPAASTGSRPTARTPAAPRPAPTSSPTPTPTRTPHPTATPTPAPTPTPTATPTPTPTPTVTPTPDPSPTPTSTAG